MNRLARFVIAALLLCSPVFAAAEPAPANEATPSVDPSSSAAALPAEQALPKDLEARSVTIGS